MVSGMRRWIPDNGVGLRWWNPMRDDGVYNIYLATYWPVAAAI